MNGTRKQQQTETSVQFFWRTFSATRPQTQTLSSGLKTEATLAVCARRGNELVKKSTKRLDMAAKPLFFFFMLFKKPSGCSQRSGEHIIVVAVWQLRLRLAPAPVHEPPPPPPHWLGPRLRPARMGLGGRISGPLSSCRDPQPALNCPCRSDRVTRDGAMVLSVRAAQNETQKAFLGWTASLRRGASLVLGSWVL